MTIRTTFITFSLIAASLVTGTAQAALQGRDLDGSASSFEAYYDTDLDITWLADANYAKTSGYDADGKMTWQEAVDWAASLSFYNSATGQTYADWRLPAVDSVGLNLIWSTTGGTNYGYNITSPSHEMSYMFYVNLGNPGYYPPTGSMTPSGCYVNSADTCLDNTGPFTNLQPVSYWSGAEYTSVTSQPYWWFFAMDVGNQAVSTARGNNAWAVHPGDVAAVPEAQTYALMLAGLGLVGWRVRRRG